MHRLRHHTRGWGPGVGRSEPCSEGKGPTGLRAKGSNRTKGLNRDAGGANDYDAEDDDEGGSQELIIIVIIHRCLMCMSLYLLCIWLCLLVIWLEVCWSFGWKPVVLFSATEKTRNSRETSARRLAERLLVTWLEACGSLG